MASYISLRAGPYDVLLDFLSHILPYPASMPAKHDIIPDFFTPGFLHKINFAAFHRLHRLWFSPNRNNGKPFVMKNLKTSDDRAGKWKLSVECKIFIALVRSLGTSCGFLYKILFFSSFRIPSFMGT
jgi:hypothetical protein